MIGIGLSTAFTRSTGPGPLPRPLLLIVAGQSNAGKQGTSGQTPPAKYADLGTFRIWDGSAFVDYTAGANPGDYPSAWGSEAEFVHRLRAMGQTRPVYMLRRAQGGTGIAVQSTTDWSPTTDELFGQVRTRLIAARAAVEAAEGRAPEEITLWNQGERDIQNGTDSAAYATNFPAFLAAWRNEISTGLFIVERTRPFPGYYAESFAVRKAQLDTALADPNAVAIDSDFAVADPWTELHPGLDWCEGLGARAFDAWRGTYTATWGDIADAVPGAFAFTDLADQAVGTQVTSGIVTPAGFSRDIAVSVTGGEYRVLHPDDSVALNWTSAPGRLHRWQKVQLRQTSAATAGTERTAVLTLGGVAASWSVTTAAASDTAPDPFDFTDLTGQTGGALVTSIIVTPAGFDAPAPVTVTGGEVRRLSAAEAEVEAWTASPGALVPGEKLQLRATAAAGSGATVTVTVTVGGVSADWQVTTEAAAGSAQVDYLIVGGGGPGGQGGGAGVGAGGGGGGGVLTGSLLLEVGSYPITVGAGGAVSTSNGGDSAAFGLTALGGGRGADTIGGIDLPGHDGASGGGGSGHNVGFDISGGTGLQGFDGGAGHAHSSQLSQRNGGGGGGAGADGEAAGADYGGAGGEGVVSSITGVAVVYGSGGGGGQNGSGGKYAGFPPGGTNAGRGAWKDQPVTVPVPGTGAGGGGSSGVAVPSAGASGVVVVAYPTGSLTATGGEVSSAGGMTVHRFVGGGLFEVVVVG